MRSLIHLTNCWEFVQALPVEFPRGSTYIDAPGKQLSVWSFTIYFEPGTDLPLWSGSSDREVKNLILEYGLPGANWFGVSE